MITFFVILIIGDIMDRLSDLMLSGKNVVVITGAGISTLSGIPDFRGKNGLYTKGNNVEYMLSRDCFVESRRFL